MLRLPLLIKRDSCSLLPIAIGTGLACLGLPFYVKPDSSGNTFCDPERLPAEAGVEGQKDCSEWRDCCNRRITAKLFK